MARSRISGEQIIDEDVLSEEEHDAWVHRNLVCSGTVTIDAPVMISGSGDIYCKDLYTAENSIYLGTTKLSADAGGNILIDNSPLTAEAVTTGYTGSVPIVTSITPQGVVSNSYLIFEDGVMTTVSGAPNTQITIPDSLLSIM